jgi:hypothetical protein
MLFRFGARRIGNDNGGDALAGRVGQFVHCDRLDGGAFVVSGCDGGGAGRQGECRKDGSGTEGSLESAEGT